MTLSKARKNQVSRILDAIYANGPMSRIDLSKMLNITPATMSDLTQILIDQQFLYEMGEENGLENRAGRKKILLDIKQTDTYYLGAELFENGLTLCITNNKANVVNKKELSVPILEHQAVINQIHSYIQENSNYTIQAIGIAIPGHYDNSSSYILTNNPFWQDFSLSEIKNAFKIPVFFENNVNTMAINERLFGEFKNDPNFLFMHFRRGMFSSYLYKSEIYARNNYYVGEIGHMVINPDGPQCECGKHGCLQTYASQTWMIRKARLIYESNTHTYLTTLVENAKDITMNIIIQAYHLGDTAVIHMVDLAIDYLAIAINNVIVSLDAEIIYLHAELFNNQELGWLLLHKIEQHDSKLLPRVSIEKIIKPYKKINGAKAACALAIQGHILS
ncbi:ROK family transcriptional regulator [Erysipelothrix urinaevulpis]|uniref:ROK family transcriptional regulator n=1 Tax=Erysipelothrix urinaevulpis TaxID=2683717 RepID=UPI00135A52F4|nr:ROK family transcriptional regulator [Erysipelothrix urinaevulpis]